MKSFSLVVLAGSAIVMAITGAMSFLLPFNKTTTSVHVLFAVIMVLAMLWHVVERSKGLRRHFAGRAWLGLVAVVLIVGVVTMELGIGKAVASLSYEERQADAIFRGRPDVVHQQLGDELQILKSSDDLVLSLEVDLKTEGETFVAIWAESDNGDLIETLFLSEALRYKEDYSDSLTRTDVLPVWSHRWRRLQEGTADGEVDGVSAATITRSFSLNRVLADDLRGFHLMMEVNRLDDDNDTFSATSEDELSQTLPGLGQPSVLYKAFVDFHEHHFDSYFLLQYEGHGALQGEDGIITRSSGGLTSARKLVQKALLHVDYQKED
jgi:hypothetical protein